ncbi:MAG: ABC transporter permease [Desulfobacterales bacterium]|jgi:putative ABC transport system permease protein|nr:ABC transporter permease [Desulfobacterales bacterium]
MFWKLLYRNAFRHKLRALLTVVGVAVAVLAFGLLSTLVDAWYAGVSAAAANRLVIRHAISLTFSLPIAYMEKIRAVDGVKAVSHMTWFGGVYIDRKNFFANFAVEPRSFLDLYPEFVLPEDQRSGFLKDRRGCVAGRGLAERFGWKVGDTVPLQGTIYPGDWPMTLRGVYQGRDKSTDENQLFFHWDYLNERLKERFPRRANQAGIFVIEIAHAEEAPAVAGAVDAVFKNSLAETLTETERAFQLGFVTMSEAILAAIRLVSLLIIGIIMAVVANTMIMSVRERMHEFAVFKTLGYGAFHLAGLILGESLVICAAGGALGIAGTFPVLRVLAGYVGNIFPVLDITPTTLGLDVLAAVLVALVAAAFPIRKVIAVRIVDALGRVG